MPNCFKSDDIEEGAFICERISTGVCAGREIFAGCFYDNIKYSYR